MRILGCTLLLYCATLACGAETISTNRDLSQFFAGREGCFVMYNSATQAYTRYNPKSCAARFSPCSTFKIPHTVVALETGVASGAEFKLRWDGVKRGGSTWDRDQTLRSAFQGSVVWFYQELARRIGVEPESEFVRKFQYGNMDTSGGLTNFWLESSLMISADEQVAFLQRLWLGNLPVSKEAQQVTRAVMEISRKGDRILYGKTGTGGDQEAGVARLGWFVGCVTNGKHTVLFATRITGRRDASGRVARQISEEVLEWLGI